MDRKARPGQPHGGGFVGWMNKVAPQNAAPSAQGTPAPAQANTPPNQANTSTNQANTSTNQSTNNEPWARRAGRFYGNHRTAVDLGITAAGGTLVNSLLGWGNGPQKAQESETDPKSKDAESGGTTGEGGGGGWVVPALFGAGALGLGYGGYKLLSKKKPQELPPGYNPAYGYPAPAAAPEAADEEELYTADEIEAAIAAKKKRKEQELAAMAAQEGGY